MALSAGDAEHTDWISAEGKDFSNDCPGYDTKQADCEVPVMLEFWGMWSTSLVPLLRPRVVAPNRVLSMGQTEGFDIQTSDTKLNCLK